MLQRFALFFAHAEAVADGFLALHCMAGHLSIQVLE